MGRHDDQRIYRTFEEFEREELRRMDAIGTSVDEMLEDLFADELDFDAPSSRRSARDEDADDEE
jgi:hypothetical protein